MNAKRCKKHCWHISGIGGGSCASDGSGSSWGEKGCCHCGKREKFSYEWKAQRPVQHGPYFTEEVIYSPSVQRRPPSFPEKRWNER